MAQEVEEEEKEIDFFRIRALGGFRYENIIFLKIEDEEAVKRFKEYYERYKKIHKIITLDAMHGRETYYVVSYRTREGGVEIKPEEIVLNEVNGTYYYPYKWKEGAKLFIPYSRIDYIEDPEESSPYTSIGIALLLGGLVGLPVAISILGNLMKTEGKK